VRWPICIGALTADGYGGRDLEVLLTRLQRSVPPSLVHRLHGDATRSRGLLDMRDLLRVQVDQFYGIEIDASAAHIARVALWITDHQMNLVAAQRLGQARPSVPLTHSATIAEGNALRLDWATVLPPGRCSYVVGNPPFVGAKFLSDAQREDVALAFGDLKNAGLLDLVAAWYVKAARYIRAAPAVRAAFVSTNSITQGEQVGGALRDRGLWWTGPGGQADL
jgi:hypothetical protein